VVIVQSQLTTAPDDFGTDQSVAAAPGVPPSDIRVSGGIGPAIDLPVAADDPATAAATSDSEAAAAQPDPSTSGEADTASGRAADDPAALIAGIPIGVELPTLGVRADVFPVGITAGQLDVPTDPADVGWWTGSVAAGSPAGATIIDGHVDSAELGAGALYRLTDLTIATFGPFYEDSFRPLVGEAVFTNQHGNWRTDYAGQVAGLHDPARHRYVAVAEIDATIAGYVAWAVEPERRNAEVTILAVSAEFRRHRVGTALCEHAFDAMRDLGAEVVMIGTGGDGFHAPARALYEALDCTPLPVAVYYREL
jgi:ribosomal protein S18 acetylase RimI-like enzyme